MLIEYQTKRGEQDEIDLFIVQAVLDLLCLQKIDTAEQVCDAIN